MNVVVEKTPGEPAIEATLGPGNFFGEMSLLTGAVRTASIQVVEAEFVVMTKRALLPRRPIAEILSERQAALDAEWII